MSVSLDPAQRAEAVGARTTRHVAGVGIGLELVRHVGTEVELNTHPGSAEPLRIGEVLVTEDVELADLDVARGQVGKVGGASWRGIRRDNVSAIGLSQVSLPPIGVVGTRPCIDNNIANN